MNSRHVQPSRGVVFFGWLFIITSLLQLRFLINERQMYLYFYSYMPPWMMLLRYSFSWFQRLLGLLAGVGILTLREPARKLALVIAWFTILTVFWKHPYAGYKLHTQYLDKTVLPMLTQVFGPFPITFSSLTVWSMVLNWLCEIAFDGALIYFFTRPSVKQQFKPNA